jgi:hypothetical protein
LRVVLFLAGAMNLASFCDRRIDRAFSTHNPSPNRQTFLHLVSAEPREPHP